MLHKNFTIKCSPYARLIQNEGTRSGFTVSIPKHKEMCIRDSSMCVEENTRICYFLFHRNCLGIRQGRLPYIRDSEYKTDSVVG